MIFISLTQILLIHTVISSLATKETQNHSSKSTEQTKAIQLNSTSSTINRYYTTNGYFPDTYKQSIKSNNGQIINNSIPQKIIPFIKTDIHKLNNKQNTTIINNKTIFQNKENTTKSNLKISTKNIKEDNHRILQTSDSISTNYYRTLPPKNYHINFTTVKEDNQSTTLYPKNIEKDDVTQKYLETLKKNENSTLTTLNHTFPKKVNSTKKIINLKIGDSAKNNEKPVSKSREKITNITQHFQTSNSKVNTYQKNSTNVNFTQKSSPKILSSTTVQKKSENITQKSLKTSVSKLNVSSTTLHQKSHTKSTQKSLIVLTSVPSDNKSNITTAVSTSTTVLPQNSINANSNQSTSHNETNYQSPLKSSVVDKNEGSNEIKYIIMGVSLSIVMGAVMIFLCTTLWQRIATLRVNKGHYNPQRAENDASAFVDISVHPMFGRRERLV